MGVCPIVSTPHFHRNTAGDEKHNMCDGAATVPTSQTRQLSLSRARHRRRLGAAATPHSPSRRRPRSGDVDAAGAARGVARRRPAAAAAQGRHGRPHPWRKRRGGTAKKSPSHGMVESEWRRRLGDRGPSRLRRAPQPLPPLSCHSRFVVAATARRAAAPRPRCRQVGRAGRPADMAGDADAGGPLHVGYF